MRLGRGSTIVYRFNSKRDLVPTWRIMGYYVVRYSTIQGACRCGYQFDVLPRIVSVVSVLYNTGDTRIIYFTRNCSTRNLRALLPSYPPSKATTELHTYYSRVVF